jgi:hypothetical protein
VTELLADAQPVQLTLALALALVLMLVEAECEGAAEREGDARALADSLGSVPLGVAPPVALSDASALGVSDAVDALVSDTLAVTLVVAPPDPVVEALPVTEPGADALCVAERDGDAELLTDDDADADVAELAETLSRAEYDAV